MKEDTPNIGAVCQRLAKHAPSGLSAEQIVYRLGRPYNTLMSELSPLRRNISESLKSSKSSRRSLIASRTVSVASDALCARMGDRARNAMARQSTGKRIRWLPFIDTALHTTFWHTTRRSVRGGMLRIVPASLGGRHHGAHGLDQAFVFFMQRDEFVFRG